MEFEEQEEFNPGNSGSEAFETHDEYAEEVYDQQFEEAAENTDTAFGPVGEAYQAEYYPEAAEPVDDSDSIGFDSFEPAQNDPFAIANSGEDTGSSFFGEVYEQAAGYLSPEYGGGNQANEDFSETGGTFNVNYGDVASQNSFLDDWTFKPTVKTGTDDSRDNPQNQERDRREREDQEEARRRGEKEVDPPITLKDIKENTWDRLFGDDKPAPLPPLSPDPVTRSIERAREAQEARERYRPEPLRQEDFPPPADLQPGDFPPPDENNRPG